MVGFGLGKNLLFKSALGHCVTRLKDHIKNIHETNKTYRCFVAWGAFVGLICFVNIFDVIFKPG